MDYNRELKLLYALDFGQKEETIFRVVGTLFGAGVVYVYTGWWYSWLWPGLFSCGLMLYWLAHQHWAGRANAKVVGWFHLTILFNTILFVWMPVKMIAYNDPPMTLAGSAVLACVYVFMVRQLDHALWVVIAQFFILAIGSGIGYATILAHIEMPIAMVGLVSSWLAFNLYFLQVVFIVRKDQQQARLAAERSAQSSKMEALGQMAGGVAHDFNNILTAAMGHLELAKVVPTDAEREECLDQAHSSLNRAARVIRDILQFARPSSSGIETRSTMELLAKIHAISTHTVVNSISVRKQDMPGDLWVSLDEDQFITAMMNLMINASHAAGASGRITLGVEPVMINRIKKDLAGQSIAPGCYVQFSVSDDGPGVPPEIADSIVKPFFTTKPESEGTGLGLSMVQAFAHRMGGGLLMSNLPVGTCFSILVPQEDAPVEEGETKSGTFALPKQRPVKVDGMSLWGAE